jgi:type I restriction enzyme, S subunit
MAGEWREVLLEDLAAPERNALVGGPFGSDLVTSDYSAIGTPVIRGENLSVGRWVSGAFVFVPPAKAATLVANTAGPLDIVFTQRGANHYRQVALVPAGATQRLVISQSQMKLTVDRQKADPLFVYYLFCDPIQQNYLQRNAIHTGVPHTNLSILRKVPLRIPSLGTQRAIAHILGTLDDKIELNRRMSETLEAMARALFKSWFVDFDPVRAKAEGRDPGLPQPLADLFPARLVDSELGEIPEGWEVLPLGDLLELAYGKALTAENRLAGIVPVYGSNGQVGWHDKRLALGPGIVVGRKGNPGVVTWAPTDFFVIDTAFYVVPKALCSSLHFLFHALRLHDLASIGADSAVPGLNRNLAYMNIQVFPHRSILDRFDTLVTPTAKRVGRLEEESRTHAALRDTLLPKLISGELRVQDAEKFVERAV